MQTLKNKQAITIDSQQVLSHIGCSDDYEPSLRIKSLVNDYIENYHNFIDFSYSYITRNIESVQEDRVIIENAITLKSKIISRLLERCDEVVIFILTIGNLLEDMVAYLAEEGLVLQATVLDAIGSGAAEQSASLVEDRIKETATSRGFVISRRFSPGYCDWGVNQQEMIFKAMQADTAGVRLTEGYLMLPRKSISGIIGIGSNHSNIDNYNPCKLCPVVDCLGRRV
jgi:hypothetical protein